VAASEREGKRQSVTIRVFILDDQEIVRAGIRHLIESDGQVEVVGEASSGPEAVRLVESLRPDVAILDIRLDGENGIEICRDLRTTYPDMACLMLTGYPDEEAFYASAMAGAAGFLHKKIRAAELIKSVAAIAKGTSLIDPSDVRLLFDQITLTFEEDPLLAALTFQETRILDLISLGQTNRQIAETLHLSPQTVKNYVSNLLAKLQVTNRTKAALYAATLHANRVSEASSVS
jgi:DNA-binding NarL/FixJ family response regulator